MAQLNTDLPVVILHGVFDLHLFNRLFHHHHKPIVGGHAYMFGLAQFQ